MSTAVSHWQILVIDPLYIVATISFGVVSLRAGSCSQSMHSVKPLWLGISARNA